MTRKRREAEGIFRRTGITFAVYTEGGDPERLIPFDIVPRILDAGEWAVLTAGLEQRVRALNAFLHDAYHGREIVRAGRVPATLVLHNEAFRPEMQDFDVPAGAHTHVAGIDIVRTGPADFYVLEDNCRTPSTLRSNLTVGLPIDLLYFRALRDRWSAALRDAYRAIPKVDWLP